MILNQNKIYEDLFEYDFSACVFNILNNCGYDLSEINFEDKSIRNIQIGQLQKANPNIKNILKSGMKRLITIYIQENNLIEDDIVWIQKDGFISKKKINKLNLSMPIDFKNTISKLIKSMDDKKLLILYSNNTISIKGMVNKPLDISFYEMLFNIDFSCRKKIFESCEIIRQNFFNSTNIEWFTRKSKDGTLTIPLKNDQLLSVNKSFLNSIDINDVDKEVIYNNYLYPFFQSILIVLNETERKKKSNGQ